MSGPPPFFMPGMPGGAGGLDLNTLQMLLAQGGLGNADPTVIESLFASMGADVSPGFDAGAPDPRKNAVLGASASTLRNLPRVKVTAYDIAANESPECSVCLEDLLLGAPALRIPCGHLFHEECVKEWLKKSNECPVCRWELPTDNKEFEQSRAERMAGRKVRLRHTDLSVKSAAELRRFAHFLGVEVKDCLEKSELVEKISRSPQVQMISAEADGGSAPSVLRQAMFCPEDLENMGMSDLKAIMERLAVRGSKSDDKAELIRRFHEEGLVFCEAEAARRRQAAHKMQAETAAPAGTGAAAPAARADTGPPLAQRSVGQLKGLAKDLGIGLHGCVEKADIVDRIQSSPNWAPIL